MSEKNYTITAADLKIFGEAVNIIEAFLAKIHADNALATFNAGAAIMALKKPEAVEKSIPATLAQAVDDQADEKLEKLDHLHAVRRCRKGGAVSTVCKCGKHGHKTSKAPVKTPSMKELAAELGISYLDIKCYTYKHKIGVVSRKDGRLHKAFTPADVKAIKKHFRGEREVKHV